MQIYNNGNEIYKNLSVMHEVVFEDGALEAKNAQVVGDNQQKWRVQEAKQSRSERLKEQ